MCAAGCIGFRFRCLSVSSFCLFVILASESSQKNEEELYCVHTWLHWVQIQMFVCFFSFQLLCKSFTTKSSGEATQINLQNSNTLIWTFLSLCKELQSLCWSSGETKLLKKWRKLLRRHRPQTASASRKTLRKFLT